MIREFIQHNFWLKLISLVLAVIIWFMIQLGIQSDFKLTQNPITNPIIQESLALPLQVLTQPGDARVFQVAPREVTITITGEAAVLREISKRDYKAYVDLTLIHHNEPMMTEKVRLHVPSGVTVMAVSPQAVKVEQVSP